MTHRMDSILLESGLPGSLAREELKGELPPQQAAAAIAKARTAARRAIYNYAPVDLPGIRALAAKPAAAVKDLQSLTSAVQTIKPSALEAMLLPLVRETRPQEYLITKKCDSAVYIAVSCYLGALFERVYPPAALPAVSMPPAAGFKFAAMVGKWVLVRKASAAAEPKETFACLVATAQSLGRKSIDLAPNGPEFLSKLSAFLDARPSRRSLGNIPKVLSALTASGLLSGASKDFEEYAVERAFSHCGYSPYCSVELVNGVYPELKIPKPRGRMKKA